LDLKLWIAVIYFFITSPLLKQNPPWFCLFLP